MPFPPPEDFPNLKDQTQVSLYCRQILYHLSHQGSPSLIGGDQLRIKAHQGPINTRGSQEFQQKGRSVQSLSRVQLFETPWTAAHQASLSITNSGSLFKLMSIESVMPSNHFILCHPLLLLPSIFPSIRVFSNESVLCNRWPKYWSFSFSISPSNEYSALISFRMDWLDLFAVQGTLKSYPTPQIKSINSLVLNFLYGPTLISIYDYWKNHNFD